MDTEKKKLDAADLAQFTGTEQWYRHWLGKALYTDGVKFVADQAGARERLAGLQ